MKKSATKNRVFACGIASLMVFATVAMAVPVQPTAYEQYVLELINRARANPEAEAARCGIDLNWGLAPGTISPDPKNPLAFHLNLVDSARKHSEWEIANNTIDHLGQGGSTPRDRAVAAGYPTGVAVSENLGWLSTFEDPPDWIAMAEEVHSSLFYDNTHREILMNAPLFEVGVGVGMGWMEPLPGLRVETLTITEDFTCRRLSGYAYLTGVAYADGAVLEDGFYTPGEGLSGVAIEARRTSDGARFNTTTFNSGGYSLPLPPGTYTVTASGGALGTVAFSGVTMNDQNVKLDFVPGSSPPPPPPPPPPVDPSPEVRVTQGTTDVTVEISLAAGGLEGQNAEWWILAQKGSSWYSWDSQTGTWKGGLRPAYQKPLCNSPITKVLQARLPVGKYTFYFAVDTIVNGRVDMSAIYYGKAAVTVSQ